MTPRRLNSRWGGWSAEGLRMRFRPRSRVGQAFLQIVPWVDFGVILLLLAVLAQRLTLSPGIVFDLPQAAFREGLYRGPTIVMASVQRSGGAETLVFFDDVRYQLDNAENAEGLRTVLGRAAAQPAGNQLLLLADRRVPQGEVVRLVSLARSAGIQRVNVAVKPE